MALHRTLAALMLVACAGCATPVARTFAPVEPPQFPHLVSATAAIEGSMVVVAITTDRPLLDLRGQDLQVLVDTDDNATTGYGAHGDEYVARVVETTDSMRFPIRLTEPADATDPAGWGAITGGGWIGTGNAGPIFRIPLSALGHVSGVLRLRVEMYAGGEYGFRDMTTGPASIAAR